jgi:predicted aspartyl protease
MNSRRYWAASVAVCATLAFLSLATRESPAITTDAAAAIFGRHAAYVGHPDGLVLRYRFKPEPPKSTPVPKESPEAGPTFPDPSTTTYRRGALYRTVSEFSGVTGQSGFTGRAFWSANYNGYTAVNYEGAARRRLTENLIDADLLDANLEATVRPAETIDGKAVDVVRVAPAAGIPADVAFDRATGAYVQVTFDPERKYGAHAVMHIDGYEEIGPGIRVPKGFHSGTGEAGRYELSAHTVRTVTNDDLKGPVPTAKWSFASTDTVPIDVVEYHSSYALGSQSGAVLVHASIGGHPGTFLLDSGAAGIILFRSYADKLKYTKLGRTGFRGVNGSGIGARFVHLDDPIEVGKNALSNVIVTVQDGAGGPGSLNETNGIVGYDFLAGALVDVDTAEKTIRILDPSAMEPAVGRGAFAFTVNLANRTPQIVMKAVGVTARPTVDTGNSAWIILSDELATSGRIVALTRDQRIFRGVDGLVRAKCSRLSLVEVGPYKYEKAETCFAETNVFGPEGGLIGFDFLKHFNWTFDYAESKLVLTPNGK